VRERGANILPFSAVGPLAFGACAITPGCLTWVRVAASSIADVAPEAVVETLLTHGIDTLFALPGVHNDHLFDAAHKASDRIRVIHSRHEQTAAYMALGAALVTGKPQAFAVVPGPGILNASAALLLAYAMGAPVIALAGQIPSFAIDRGHGHLHEIHDQIGLLRHIVKQGERIRSPQEASARVAPRPHHPAMDHAPAIEQFHTHEQLGFRARGRMLHYLQAQELGERRGIPEGHWASLVIAPPLIACRNVRASVHGRWGRNPICADLRICNRGSGYGGSSRGKS